MKQLRQEEHRHCVCQRSRGNGLGVPVLSETSKANMKPQSLPIWNHTSSDDKTEPQLNSTVSLGMQGTGSLPAPTVCPAPVGLLKDPHSRPAHTKPAGNPSHSAQATLEYTR